MNLPGWNRAKHEGWEMEGMMNRRYRILFLDRSQIVTRQEHIDARDDDAAVNSADRLAGSQAAEVWDGLRQVALLARERATARPRGL